MAYADQLSHGIADNLATLLLQIVFILALCRVIGYALLPLKQPAVSGEILAGIIMGPSVIGQSKIFFDFMFPPRNAVLLKGISDLGVTMFMFILGLEFSPAEMFKSLKKTWMIGACGIILPFALGAASASYLYTACGMDKEDYQVGLVGFILFVGAAMSFTAFPVLARILTANDAMTAQIGLVSMGVASVDDVLAWTVLAIATSYSSGGNPQDGAWGILLGIAWVALLLIAIKPLLRKIQVSISENNFIVLIFMGMCVSAWFTQILGLHAFFGAFCFGISVPKDDQVFVLKFIDQLEVVVVNFFVPLFFANTGLRTDLTALSSSVGPVLLVLALACVGKLAPAFFLGKCRGYSWRFSFQLASLMNARGLIGLIALEMARDARAFNTETSSVFVVMALVTTLMAGPMFHFAYRKSTDPPRPIVVTTTTIAGVVSPKHASNEEDPSGPEVEEQPKCSEIPEEEQMDLTAGSYGYLFQRTLYRQQQQSDERTSVMDVFGLHLRQNSHPETVNLSTLVNHEHTEHGGRKVITPRFDSLRSATWTYPSKKNPSASSPVGPVRPLTGSIQDLAFPLSRQPSHPSAGSDKANHSTGSDKAAHASGSQLPSAPPHRSHHHTVPPSILRTVVCTPSHATQTISQPIPVITSPHSRPSPLTPHSRPSPLTPHFDGVTSTLSIVSESVHPGDPPSISSRKRHASAPTSPRSISHNSLPAQPLE